YSTVTGNRSDSDGNGSGAGGGLDRGSYGVSVLNNTIVAGNFVGTGTTASDIHASVDTAKSFDNLIGTGGSGELQAGVNGNQVGVDVAAVLDSALADNGGPDQNHAPEPRRPAPHPRRGRPPPDPPPWSPSDPPRPGPRPP